MSYISFKKTTMLPNFLASEIGLVQRTRNFNSEGVTADEQGYKTIKAGTIFPANDTTAEGIVFEDVDVTRGAHAGSLIVAGRIFSNRLPVALNEAALAALEKQGFYFETVPETSREDT